MKYQYQDVKRNRIILCIAFIVIVFFGLLSRSHRMPPSFFVEYGGDTLWAAMMYIVFAFIKPRGKILYICLITLVFSYLIEFSQMLTWQWLVYLRTTPFRYILGQGFVWSDLLCYTIGCVGMMMLDYLWLRKKVSWKSVIKRNT